MKKLLILLPLLTLSCADTWSEKATTASTRKVAEGQKVLQALPVNDDARAETPNLPLPEDNHITFVTPDTTERLVGEDEKRSVSPELKAPERPSLDSNTVNTTPPAPKVSPPKD